MSVSESDKPMRLTMEKWASPSGAIKIAESDRYEVYEGMRNERISNLRKMSENSEVLKVSKNEVEKVTSQIVPHIVVSDKSKQEHKLSRQASAKFKFVTTISAQNRQW